MIPTQVRGEVVDMATMVARDAELRARMPRVSRDRGDAQGVWEIPSRGATFFPHSGQHNVVNKWGDTRMGIGFPTLTDVSGVYVTGQAARGAWTTGLKVVGYRHGEMVGFTDWFENIDDQPRWLAIDLEGVDRIVFEARPVLGGAGWYAIDDLTYSPQSDFGDDEAAQVVLTFEDCEFRTTLTDSGYRGLTWETGTGDFAQVDIIPAPQPIEVPIGEDHALSDLGLKRASAGGATAPILENNFQGVIRGDAGVGSAPPDSHGAIGPNHFVSVVNLNFAVYDRTTGSELQNIRLDAFHPGSSGDPRVVFDHHSGRWIVINSDFSTDLFLAISMTSDPLGSWFTGQFTASAGPDAGCWPDYPTLGVDADGIYTGALMVGGCGMTVFAIEKAPLLGVVPTFGAVTAFRGLPFAGAYQPVYTHGTPGVEYVISRNTSTTLRLRAITGPLTAPSMLDLGNVAIASTSTAPDAPALNSTTDINTIDPRPLNAVYRNGMVWMTHDVATSFGTAGCRWYQINPLTTSVVQTGTIEDASLHYFYGSIAVNVDDNVVMGFSGSNASQFVATYYTGRLSTDAAGTMATPMLLRAGQASYTVTDGFGRNRWGDYSHTSIDPLNDRTFFTVQEYAHGVDIWGTQIAELSFCALPPANDCNGNCIEDALDIASTSLDCNNNAIPDECDLGSMASGDCNNNSVPDECEDCNLNGVADECELITAVDADSMVFTPFGFESGLQEFILVNPVAPSSDVTFTFTGNLPVAGNSNVMATLNGQAFPPDAGFSVIFPNGVGADCPTISIDTIVISAAEFLSITGGGDATVGLQTFDFQESNCDLFDITSVQVNVSYTGNILLDLNENGLLDSCECDEDCSGDLDGFVGINDFLAILANWGTSSTCDFAPMGGDGTVGIDEFLAVLAKWGACFSP